MKRYENISSCELCEKTFQNENKLNVHMSGHSASNIFHCDHSDNVFGTDFELEWHEETTHIIENSTTLKCEVCELVFLHDSDLNQHKQAYHIFNL